jgi:hypothetical protein
MLKFSEANAKTEKLRDIPELARYLAGGNKVYSFDLLAGWSCPFAEKCLSKVYIENGKRRLQDGPNTQFRCFSASQEIAYTNTYNARKHNFDILRKLHLNDMVYQLDRSIPKNCGICRIHVSGDFFSPDYMFAWINMAMRYKYILFYAYTKSIPYWIKHREYIKSLPNFILTASYGGRYDRLIGKHRLRYSKVVFTESDAGNLPIDHDDSHAATKGGNFALLLHGVQPAGTPAAKALVELRGKGSYSRKPVEV